MPDLPHPTVAPDGVPFCAYEKCVQYDGKRCRMIGNEPRGICEPAVVDMHREVARLRTLLAEACHLTMDAADSTSDIGVRISAIRREGDV